MRVALVLALAAALAACDSGTPASPTPETPLVVASASELGPIAAPPSVTARDAGISARVGDRVLWLFADTIFNPASADGTNGRSSTAAYAPLSTPRVTTEPTDVNGAPAQAVPFTATEVAYNRDNAPTRIALWPGGVLPTAGGALTFSNRLVVRPGLFNYENLGVDMAEFTAGETVGRRVGQLFGPSDPLFLNPLLRDGFVYLYGLNVINGSRGIGVARVPVAQVRERSAYRAWNGTAWTADLPSAATLFTNVPGSVSVSWNDYLGRYVAVSSLGLTNRVVVRTAAAPEGQWSAPTDLFTGVTPGEGVDYAGEQHAELAEEGGKIIYVSYYRPESFLRGQLRLVRVTFQ